jgi:hypothetical protein
MESRMPDNAPGAIVLYTGGEKPPQKEVSLEEAASKKRKRQATNTKLTVKKLAEGDVGKIYVPFYYANGDVQPIHMKALTARIFAIRKGKSNAKSNNSSAIVLYKSQTGKAHGIKRGQAVKPIQLSLGRKSITRKKGTKKQGAGTKTLVQAWTTVSVPIDATLVDILFWVRSFQKPVGIVRYGSQDIIVNENRARATAGAQR